MKILKIIFIVIIATISIGILFYLAEQGVSTNKIQSFSEFMSSSTETDNLDKEISSSENESDELIEIKQVSTTTIDKNFNNTKFSVLKAPKFTFNIQIANNSTTREIGLSGRQSLDNNEGLLFIFPKVGSYGFWMKGMNFPIDIVWIDANKKIIGITESISPESYPNMFYPPSSIQFVLEINAGMAKKAGLSVGSVLSF